MLLLTDFQIFDIDFFCVSLKGRVFHCISLPEDAAAATHADCDKEKKRLIFNRLFQQKLELAISAEIFNYDKRIFNKDTICH